MTESRNDPEWRSGVRRVRLWLFSIAAILIIVIALLVSVFRVVVPQVPAYRGEVVAWASDVLGAPVAIGTLDLQWRGVRPELVLRDVHFVSADARGAVAAREVRVAISLRTLLAQGRFTPARVTVIEPDVTLDLDEWNHPERPWDQAFGLQPQRAELIVSRGRVTLSFDAGRRRVDLVGLDLAITSDGSVHRIRATSRIGPEIGGLVHLRGHIAGWPGTEGFSAQLHAEARGMDLRGLQHLGRIARVESGRMDIVADLEIVDGLANDFAVETELVGLVWPADDPAAGVDHAAAALRWMRDESGWAVVLDRFEVGRSGVTRSSGPVAVEFADPTAGDPTATWTFSSDRLEIGDMVSVVEALPWQPDAGVAALIGRSPAGTLEHAHIVVDRAPGQSPRYRFEAAADGLQLAPSSAGAVPGFSGVSVSMSGDHDGGRFAVVIDDGEVEWAQVFRGSMPVRSATAEGSWRHDDGAWAVEAESIRSTSDELQLDARLNLELDDDGQGGLRVEADILRADLAARYAYLPVVIMPQGLIDWLDRAVVGGTVTGGSAAFAMRFGEDAPSPELDIRFSASGAGLDYARGWPELEDATLEAMFTWAGFSAQIHEGMLAGNPVRDGRVSLDEYVTAPLRIAASAGDDLGALYAGFRRTPVGDVEWLQQLAVGGRGSLALRLGIDLGSMAVDVAGDVDLDGADVAIVGFDHPFTGLHGSVGIVGDGFMSEGLRGTFLDRDVMLSARTLRDSAGEARAVEVILDGRIDPGALALLTGNDALPVDGSTDWQARLLAPYDDAQPPLLQVESDLDGLSVMLPAPLGKSADELHPTILQVELGLTQRRLVVDGDGRVRVDAIFSLDDEGWWLSTGRAHLGGGAAGPLPNRDFAVTGRLGEWAIALGRLTPTIAATELPLTAVDLVIGRFTAWGHELGEVALTGSRTEPGWHWVLDGEHVAGALDLPDHPTADSPVRAEFTRLHLPVVQRTPGSEPIHADPTTLPPIAFHAGDLRIGIVHLGEVNGMLRRAEHGVVLDGFTARRDEMRMTAEARWQMVDGEHRTELSGVLESTDVRPTLMALGYAGAIEATNGHIEADLVWMDSPLVNPLPSLNGTFRVRMDRGTLLDLEPGTGGRLFGMLSLQTLPRRMALDFSDVYRRGLAFDTISGSFEVVDGDAYTEDLALRGPAARVDIVGRTGLATRDYDQVATVVGSLASSLTLAGTLVGGPAVGAALLLVSELLRGALEDMVRVRYQLTGPWEEPVVERLPSEPR